jgi:hypothetical protein
MSHTLAPEDIKKFLKRASVAIELEQLYVDMLPPESFSPQYNDGMWRDWRRDHRSFIEMMLSTADAIPPATLRELTAIATTREPAEIGRALVELFGEVVGDCCPKEDLATATQFLGRLTEEMRNRPESKLGLEARASILLWLPAIDPLRIARDPECGYPLQAH